MPFNKFSIYDFLLPVYIQTLTEERCYYDGSNFASRDQRKKLGAIGYQAIGLTRQKGTPPEIKNAVISFEKKRAVVSAS